MHRLPVIIFIAVLSLCLSAQAQEEKWEDRAVLDPQNNRVYRIKSLDSEQKWADVVDFRRHVDDEDAPVERRAFKDLIPELTDRSIWARRYIYQNRPAEALAAFPGNVTYAFDLSNRNNPAPFLAPTSDLIAEVSPRSALLLRTARDEQGKEWRIEAHFEGGLVMLLPAVRKPGHPYQIRALNGLHVYPDYEGQLASLRQKTAPEVLELFEDIRKGRTLDLNQANQMALFRAYLALNLEGADLTFTGELSNFLNQNSIAPKPALLNADIVTTSGAKLRLRPLPIQLAPFRGCLGQDCSTRTRFLRALEPGHLNFAIEKVPYEPIGQIEIVFGSSPNGTRLGFFERIQSAKKLRPHHVEALLVAVKHVLADQGITLVALEEVEMYRALGHPISNNHGVEKMFQSAVEKRFVHANPTLFHRDPDQYKQGDETGMNLIAKKAEENGASVFTLHELTEQLPDRIKAIEYTAPQTTFAPVDFQKISAELKSQLQFELKNRHTSEFSTRVLTDVLKAFPGCEARLRPQLEVVD